MLRSQGKESCFAAFFQRSLSLYRHTQNIWLLPKTSDSSAAVKIAVSYKEWRVGKVCVSERGLVWPQPQRFLHVRTHLSTWINAVTTIFTSTGQRVTRSKSLPQCSHLVGCRGVTPDVPRECWAVSMKSCRNGISSHGNNVLTSWEWFLELALILPGSNPSWATAETIPRYQTGRTV